MAATTMILPSPSPGYFSPSSTVDAKQFAALEQKFDTLVLQLQKLLPRNASSESADRDAFKRHLLPAAARPSLPMSPDISLPGTPALDAQLPSVAVPERAGSKIALQILDIIQRYGSNVAGGDPWAGKAKFVPMVEAYVAKNEPVQMVLPAFPFKSPNRKDKTLGHLPDLGEEIGLQHLNGLCESIAEIYQPAANVVITSDGLVYNGKSHLECI